MVKKGIVETYSKTPAAKRVDIIINNFTIFEDLIKGEEECLYVQIRRDQEDRFNEQRSDLGVRIQTSHKSDITGDTATANADTQAGIENGDWRLATRGLKDNIKYRKRIETLQMMRDDYTIVRGKLKGIRDDDHVFMDYLMKEKNYDEMADNLQLSHEAVRSRVFRTKAILKENALESMEAAKKCA